MLEYSQVDVIRVSYVPLKLSLEGDVFYSEFISTLTKQLSELNIMS